MSAVRFHAAAAAELGAAIARYQALLPGLGAAFAAQVRKTVDLIQSYPDACAPFGARYRKTAVRRFPFALIYTHHGDHVLILAVAGQRRRPGA